MFIHFLFVEHKEFKNIYIVTIKSEDEILDTKLVNESLYNNLYFNNNEINNNTNINYYSIFYIKKGFIIKNDIHILWNQLLHLYMKNINLINLIDINYINKLKEKNILLFDTNIYKNDLTEIIINLHSI